MSRNGASSSRGGNGGQAAGRKEEQAPPNNQLPRSGVVRMMRRVLEADVKVSSPAKNLAQGCAAEFINAVVDEAAKRCNQDGRSMLTPEDVAWSLRSLGLDRYVEPMGTYLRRYREAAGGTAPAVEDPTDEELSQILAQMMSDNSS